MAGVGTNKRYAANRAELHPVQVPSGRNGTKWLPESLCDVS